MALSRSHALDVVLSALAAEACCQPGDFTAGGVRLSEVSPNQGGDRWRRRFPRPEHSLAITTTGAGAVVSATPSWMPWVAEVFREADPGAVFSPGLLGAASWQASRYSYSLHGPVLYSVASSRDWRAHETPDGYTVDVGGAELLASLVDADWPNAISARASAQGRHVAVAAVAVRRDAVAGVVAATADSDVLWQLGVDVKVGHRGKGLGRVLTSRVTEAVLQMGRVPYYGSPPDNVASRRTAQSVGFFPAWVSAFTVGHSSR